MKPVSDAVKAAPPTLVLGTAVRGLVLSAESVHCVLAGGISWVVARLLRASGAQTSDIEDLGLLENFLGAL